MLSRVADAIFWMERYRERAESTARIIDCSLHLFLDVRAEDRQWAPLVKTTGDYALFQALHGQPTEKNVLRFLTFDEANPNSILSSLTRARDNARSVRESITSEMWQEINQAYLYVQKEAAAERGPRTPNAFYRRIREHSQLFDGIVDTTLSRDEAWHFCRLGQMLERADNTSRILDVKYFILLPAVDYVGAPYDNLQWGALLESAGAFQMYRKRHPSIFHTDVVEFLVLNPEFPRSILNGVRRAEGSLRALSGSAPGTYANEAERRLGRLAAELQYLRVDDIMARGLHEFLNDIQIRLNEVNAAIFNDFFALHPVPAGT